MKCHLDGCRPMHVQVLLVTIRDPEARSVTAARHTQQQHVGGCGSGFGHSSVLQNFVSPVDQSSQCSSGSSVSAAILGAIVLCRPQPCEQ